ncbi:MAG: filamentous hemagglutinin N-terminal domain-containing protein [Oscillatoriophycideae cyanobacterium NC_groundwater_1537_Pr4_S-0.65um_50_18]|nr:filamentous hemagglutinin N-terminal domain-containing protein [Oscillatoriophycideae cyanobacterium NC_groundwater_1537_Pr4_S-0.65um_50_18]
MSSAIALSPLPAMAQRAPIADETLGDEQSIVSPDEVIRGVPSNRIDGGARRGTNLFHSFQEFNIDAGRGAYFTNPDGVTNILTRVTGGNQSDILGTLGVLGNANLFLINPNGILFGQDARLDVGGSFVSSTANSIGFDNGFTFSATNPQAPPLLTVSAPIGLQYGRNPGEVRSQGASLQVPDGQTLTLAGGAVSLDGGELLAPGGRVELGGVSAAGAVGLNRDGSLSFPDNVARADVLMTNAASVDVRAGGGGSITVNARNLEVRGGSQLLAGIPEDLRAPEAQAGDITINATHLVRFDGEDQDGSDSGAFNTVESGAEGSSGSISVTTGSLEVLKGAQFDASTFGVGNSGSVTIYATDFIRFAGEGMDGFESGARSEVVSGSSTNAVGSAGGISITTGSLEVLNGAQLSASTSGVGNAGSVTIHAADLVRFAGEGAAGQPSGAFSNVNRRGVGNAGGVSITARSLEVTNDGEVSASTFGRGNAGSVIIRATDLVRFAGEINGDSGGAFSQVNDRAIGNAGGVSITAGSLEVLNGTNLAASTFGVGNAGGVTINATGLVRFDGVNESRFSSGAFSSVNFSNRRNAPAEGNAGGISITTKSLELLNGGLLDASTSGVGNAGNITITARDTVSFDGVGAFPSGAYSSVEPGAIGRAGSISITTNSFTLTDGGIVSANTSGQGDAGKIMIRASDSVSFNGIGSNGDPSGAFSSVGSGAIGRGGNIRISADRLSLTNGAQVNAATEGQGRAGNITFNTPRLTVAGNAQVLAETSSIGNGGSIQVNAPTSVSLRRSNNLSPVLSVETSGAGQAGNITLNTPYLNLAERARITATATTTATNRQGGGSVTLNASNLDLAGIVGVFAETQGQTPAGTLRLNPYRNQPDLDIILTPRSEISASTSSSGRGGDLIVTAPRSITITGSGRLATETKGIGNAGNMTFTTQQLSLSDGVEISASTSGSGRGGDAGDIDINAERFTLSDGSQVTTNTANRGAAGDLTVQVSDQLFLTGRGTGLFASTTPSSMGNGGNIAIDPRQIQIENGATIAVDSQGRGRGGNISLQANRLVLNRQGSITAKTTSAQGGDISLQIPDLLLLQQGSSISTTAGNNRTGGNGGNISFDGQFIVAAPNENSDISANAFTGRGGNVEINAQSIFGIQSRPQPTAQSDITASSEQGIAGVVDITTPDVDPSRGLVQLPVEVTDASRLIAQTCPTGNSVNQQNQFIVTGRGGLPPTPSEAMNQDAIQVDLVAANIENEPAVSQRESSQNPLSLEEPIAEAQGFQIAADGRVILGAAAPESAIASSPNRIVHCR